MRYAFLKFALTFLRLYTLQLGLLSLSLVRVLVHLCPLMDGMQTPPGTTECNHSYYTGNSFSVSHSAQQLQNDTPATPMQPPASVQEVDAPASSGVMSSSLLSCSAFSSQVTVDRTRYGTGDDMPLADAITQLSFLQRCGSLNCSSPAVSTTSFHLTSGCHCADDSTL